MEHHQDVLLLLFCFFCLIRVAKPVDPAGSPASVRRIPSSREATPGIVQLQIDAFGLVHKLTLKEARLFHPQMQQYIVETNPWSKISIASIVPRPLHGRWYMAQDKTATALYVELFDDGRLRVEGLIDDNVRIAPIGVPNGWQHMAYERPIFNPPKSSHCPSASNAIPDLLDVNVRAIPPNVQPEVNQIFATIATPRIANVITSIVMTKDRFVESSWVIKDKTSGLIDAAATLPAFGKWLYQQRQSIVPNFDVAIWSTGLNLGLLKNGSWSSEVLGHAYIGSACHVEEQTNYNVALSEDKVDKFTGIRTHAHELAHLYGAAHDGEHVDNPIGNPGAFNCPWNDGYVMSYKFGTKNTFYFSECSAIQIQHMLQSSRGRCLLDIVQKTNQVPANATLPGTFITLDDQCRSRHGLEYHFYQEYASEVCLKLWCAKIIDNSNAAITTSGASLEVLRTW
ncbi:hypothetical protein CHUAL_011654 [Chamberlinius hualienensis]